MCYDLHRVRHSLSNGFIANVVLHINDLDPNFQDQIFETLASRKHKNARYEWHYCECCTPQPWPKLSKSEIDTLKSRKEWWKASAHICNDSHGPMWNCSCYDWASILQFLESVTTVAYIEERSKQGLKSCSTLCRSAFI